MKFGGVLAGVVFGLVLSVSSGNAAVPISGNFGSGFPVLNEAGGATFTPLPLVRDNAAMESVGCTGCGGSGPGDPPPPGIPEPATWAMMLIGFGATGFAMRGRKQRALTA